MSPSGHGPNGFMSGPCMSPEKESDSWGRARGTLCALSEPAAGIGARPLRDAEALGPTVSFLASASGAHQIRHRDCLRMNGGSALHR